MPDFSKARLVERVYDWTDWKTVQNNKLLSIQYEETSALYTIWGYDNIEVHICLIYKNNVPDGVINSYSQIQNDLDKADFENNYKNIANKSINRLDRSKRPITVTEPRIGDEVIYTTHNFCDQVSWFGESVRVNEEILTSIDGYKWQSDHIYWVDMISGRVQDDDGLVAEQMQLNPEDPHGYQVVIVVDGYIKNMRAPFITTGGDYEVYWADGYIKSFEDWTGKEVLASYSYSNGSTFILKPLPGKVLNIEAAEADFSEDVIFTDTINYSVYGYASIFAPQLGLPEGTKIPLTSTSYKRLQQVFNESIGSYPVIKVYGSFAEHRDLPMDEFRRVSRGLKYHVQSIPFRYATVRSLKSSLGLELRVKLLNNIPFDGSLATSTFYCTSADET